MSWSIQKAGSIEDVSQSIYDEIVNSTQFGDEQIKQRAINLAEGVVKVIESYNDFEHVSVNCYGHIDHGQSETYVHTAVTPLVLSEPT